MPFLTEDYLRDRDRDRRQKTETEIEMGDYLLLSHLRKTKMTHCHLREMEKGN